MFCSQNNVNKRVFIVKSGFCEIIEEGGFMHRQTPPAPRWPLMYVFSPTQKRKVKDKMKQKRRKICEKGLEKAKRVYNQTGSLEEVRKVDYYTDNLFIKRKSRKGAGADYIEQRCSGSRLTIGHYW